MGTQNVVILQAHSFLVTVPVQEVSDCIRAISYGQHACTRHSYLQYMSAKDGHDVDIQVLQHDLCQSAPHKCHLQTLELSAALVLVILQPAAATCIQPSHCAFKGQRWEICISQHIYKNWHSLLIYF